MIAIAAVFFFLGWLSWPIISSRYHRHVRSSERFADAMDRLAELQESED